MYKKNYFTVKSGFKGFLSQDIFLTERTHLDYIFTNKNVESLESGPKVYGNSTQISYFKI